VRPLVDGEPAFRRICEAVAAARRRVWVTVAFVDRDTELPGGHGTLFDVLERAAARGLDVRALFWREPRMDEFPGWFHFRGSDEERAWLRERGARFLARWDHLPRWCHHQKSWLIDAGEPGEVAFVGGINVDRESIVSPGHAGGMPGIHDLHLELQGPAATDVHHNFVQRWNEASERGRADGAWPDARTAGDLPFPGVVSAARGAVPLQITRTVRPGCYTAAVATPGASPFAIAAGEQSVLEQYAAAIDAAERSIYLEHQLFAAPDLFLRLDVALRRGVEVVVVVPRQPLQQVRDARKDPRMAPGFALLGSLGDHPNFTFAGLVAGGGDVYVHAKAALVDDAWATIGSANLAIRSFEGDTELNASFWSPPVVRVLRQDLLREHLGRDDVAELDDRAALRRFREIAEANRERLRRGEALDGLAVALDPKRYAADDEP
jgi:phosphatidylserine/phosphatidylglycerophosphate/cardiolipin synthase-like enzyme